MCYWLKWLSWAGRAFATIMWNICLLTTTTMKETMLLITYLHRESDYTQLPQGPSECFINMFWLITFWFTEFYKTLSGFLKLCLHVSCWWSSYTKCRTDSIHLVFVVVVLKFCWPWLWSTRLSRDIATYHICEFMQESL